MADIQILRADVSNGRIQSLEVRFPNTTPRTISRETAVAWAQAGHSLIPVAGHGHDVHRGAGLGLVEVGEELFLRTDTRAESSDVVGFPGH